MTGYKITADEAMERLKRGNKAYLELDRLSCDVSENVIKNSVNGQEPYAVIVIRSDIG